MLGARIQAPVVWWESPLNINQADYLWVVAVAHGSRKPGYWKKRVV
jgi:hypothetical protein